MFCHKKGIVNLSLLSKCCHFVTRLVAGVRGSMHLDLDYSHFKISTSASCSTIVYCCYMTVRYISILETGFMHGLQSILNGLYNRAYLCKFVFKYVFMSINIERGTRNVNYHGSLDRNLSVKTSRDPSNPY